MNFDGDLESEIVSLMLNVLTLESYLCQKERVSVNLISLLIWTNKLSQDAIVNKCVINNNATRTT